MWMMHGYRYYNAPGFDWVGSILFFLGILFVVWLIASLMHSSSSTPEETEESTEDTALDILDKRYAKGELTKRQYLEMKKDIEK